MKLHKIPILISRNGVVTTLRLGVPTDWSDFKIFLVALDAPLYLSGNPPGPQSGSVTLGPAKEVTAHKLEKKSCKFASM